MKQTTRNLIRGVGVVAVMALPVSSLAVGAAKAFGHPLLEEGRDTKPKIVAQLQTSPRLENKTAPKNAGGGRIISLDGGVIPETPLETPREKQTPPITDWRAVAVGGLIVVVASALIALVRIRFSNRGDKGEESKGGLE
ncbi:MAG: hypothetical protein AABW86_03645 [Candidatus Micrarchaeota archaeon]